jgi:general secretion pathway protein D
MAPRHLRARGMALLLVSALSWSCASRSAYRQGQREARKGHWDMAVARLTLALQKDPTNIDYKIALENAKVQASRQHYDEARKAMAADDLEKASVELEVASKYDPANRSAADDLLLVRGKLERRAEEKRRLQDFDLMKARAQAKTIPVPVLSPRSPVPIVLKFTTDTSLEKVFDTLSKISGVNILLDASFHDKKVTVNLVNVTFQQALDELTFVNALFYKVIDSNTIVIAVDNTQTRRHYDDNVVRTFYLQNADPTDTSTLIKNLIAGSQSFKILPNNALQSVTVRGTPDEVALAERVIESNDKPRGEVMVEVEVLEVNRTKMKDYGIALSNYEIHASFNPSGNALDSTGFTSFQPQVLSSLNVSDFVVSIPSTLLAKFMENDSNVRLLASPRLRAAEGEKTKLKIVTQVPIPTTTFQSTNTGGATFTPITTTVYKDVGVNMELTPKVGANGDISLKMLAEFSLQGQSVQINNTSFPEFLTRSVEGLLRVRDGETSLIGGLIQGREATTLAGVLGLQSIPILNKIFNHNTKDIEDTEILISLTPHLVRAPKLTEEDLRSVLVGTQELVKVPNAHPPLFGPEEPSPQPPPPLAPGPGAPVRPSPEALASPGPPPVAPLPEAPPPELEVGAKTAAPEGGPVQPSQASVLWSPAVVTGRAGETLSLNVVVLQAQAVTGVDVTFTFDKTALEAVDIVPGSLLALDGSSVGVERSLEAGRVHAHLTRPLGTTGSGAVATLRLKGLHPGTTGIAIESFILTTTSGTEMPSLPGPGSVEVKP